MKTEQRVEKEDFDQAKFLYRRIKVIKNEKSKIESLTNENEIEIEELNKLNKELSDKTTELSIILNKVFSLISIIDDDEITTILIYRYICNIAAEGVGEKIGYARHYVITKTNSAFNNEIKIISEFQNTKKVDRAYLARAGIINNKIKALETARLSIKALDMHIDNEKITQKELRVNQLNELDKKISDEILLSNSILNDIFDLISSVEDDKLECVNIKT